MILKPTGRICTRFAVEQLVAAHPDVEEIDFSEVDVYSTSAMHQFVSSYPNAKMSGLEGWNKDQYDWVIAVINSDEFKRNRRSLFDAPEGDT